MKRLILSLLLGASALGQLWSPAQLKNHIATNLPSGGSITASKLRETLTNVVTSTLFATNNLSDLNSASAARSNLGLAIGIQVQSYDSQLDELASGSLTGYVKAAGSGSYTASSTIPATDLSGNLAIARFNSGTSASGSTFWRGDGTWAAAGSGTVTSVAASVPAFLSITGSPVTTSGTLAISYSGTALPVDNGGSGATTLTGYVKGNGTGPFTASTSIPSTVISGTLSVAVGGTGAGTLTGHLSGNGTSPITASSTIPVGDLSGITTSIATALPATPTGSGVFVLATNAVLATPYLVDATATFITVTNTLTAGAITTGDIYAQGYLKVGTGGTAVYEIKHGRATLVAGVAVVGYSGTTTSSRIMLGVYTPGGTRGFLDTGTRTAGTSFTITSSSILDTSVVDWVVVNP